MQSYADIARISWRRCMLVVRDRIGVTDGRAA